MKKSICKRFLALFLALCLLCGAGLAEAVKADKATIKQVQQALNAAGFDCGTPDGVSGKKTKAAIQQYQEANGLTANGEITEELLAAMGISLPEAGGAETELKEEKGETPVRSVRIPIGGPAYVSNFDSEALLNAPYLRWNLRVRVVGTVVDLRGLYPISQQKTDRAILIQAADGSLFLADYTKSYITVPDFHLGDQLTVSGRVGDTRIGAIQHVAEGIDHFYWGSTSTTVDDYFAWRSDREPTGDIANCVQADMIELGDAPAPNVGFMSIARTEKYSLATVIEDIMYKYNVIDVDVESGWLYLGYGVEKGYAYPSALINYYTGISFLHDAASDSEVFLCDNGLLRFEWRDARTGKVVDENLNVYYSGNSYETPEWPRTFQLYAMIYDLDGNLKEEKYLLDFNEEEGSDIDPDFEKWDVMDRYGAHSDYKFDDDRKLANAEVLNFVDEDGDAVGYDDEGNEIIRYPGTKAEGLWGVMLRKEGTLSVAYYTDEGGAVTEIFIPKDEIAEGAENPQTEEVDWTEIYYPETTDEAQKENGHAKSKYSLVFDYYGYLAGYLNEGEENIRIVGAMTDLNGKWTREAQEEHGMVALEMESGEIFFAVYARMNPPMEAPEYQPGDIITVCGRPSGTMDYEGATGVIIAPDFIAAGDVPAPDA